MDINKFKTRMKKVLEIRGAEKEVAILIKHIEEIDRDFILLPNIDENGYLVRESPHILVFGLNEENKLFSIVGKCDNNAIYLRLLSNDIEKEITEFDYKKYEENQELFNNLLSCKTHELF